MRTFKDIFGQDNAVESIRRAWLGDRLPHGLIFAGPVGVGKATTAAALGALFLCRKPAGDAPCGDCDSCRIFAAGNHPDYHEIRRELIRFYDKTGTSKGIDLSINVIRPELIERAALKAMMNHGKVFVIEEAESMTTAAQNAMLKTLEEPAGRTLIILLTDQPDSLLATIRSRCQLVRFAPLATPLIVRQLESRGVNKPIASDAARLSDGSLGLAIRWIEDGVIERARDMEKLLADLLAGRPPEDLPAWFKSAAEAYADKQAQREPDNSRDQANRAGLRLYMRVAAQFFGGRLKTAGDAGALESLCSAIEAVSGAEQYLDANVTVSLIFQNLAVTLGRLFAAGPRRAAS